VTGAANWSCRFWLWLGPEVEDFSQGAGFAEESGETTSWTDLPTITDVGWSEFNTTVSR